MPARALEQPDSIGQSEHYVRGLFDDAPVAYHETDTEGIIRRVNRAGCELVGLTEEEILGRAAWDFVVPELRETVRAKFFEMIAGGPLAAYEAEFAHSSGCLRTAVVHPRLIEDSAGTTVGMLSAHVDTTLQVEQNRRAELSSDLTSAMIFFESLDAALQHCAEAIVWRMGGAFARIWTLNKGDAGLELRASATRSTRLDGPHLRLPLGQLKVRYLVEERRPHLTNTVTGDPRIDQEWARREGIVAFAGYPLLLNEDVLGVLALFSRRPLTDGIYEALGQTALEIAVLIDRKTTEDAIHKSEARYRSIVETTAEGIWNVTATPRTTFVNQQMSQMMGLEPAACLVHPVMSFFFPEDHHLMRKRYKSLRKGNRETFDVRLRRADGTALWTRFSAAPNLAPDGHLVGILNMVTDIAEQKQAEEALRSSLEFNRRILESTGDGILLLDAAGRFQYLSPAARELLELDAVDAPLGASWVSYWVGTDRQKIEAALEKAVVTGSGSFEGTCSTARKTTRRLDVSLSAIRDSASDAPRLVAVVRDITGRKHLESQLAQAQKLESIGQLAAGVAHEINTPIQYIGDNARFLLDGFSQLRPMLNLETLSPEYREDAEYLFEEIPKAAGQLLEGVENVARIVRAMKEFSHPGPIAKTPLDLNQAVRSTIVVSRHEWKYVAEVVERLDPALPPVQCVPGEINQAVLNLIVNAAHAIADVVRGTDARGTITLSTRRDGDWAEIEVRDTGTGIPEAIRSKVFDPFFTTKEVGKGTGQGLSIAHAAIVKNHGGTIQFETETGVGTTFTIRLPIAGS